MIKSITINSLIVVFILTGCGSSPPKKQPEPLGSAQLLERQGINQYQTGRYDQAIKHFKAASLLYTSVNHTEDLARVQINLINSALTINQLALANKKINELKTLITHAGENKFHNRLQLLEAEYNLRIHNYAKANELLETILPKFTNNHIAKSSINKIAMAAIINRTNIALKTNDQNLDIWIARLKKLTPENQASKARILRLTAQYLLSENEKNIAEQQLQRAIVLYKKALYPPGIAAALQELSGIYQQLQDWSKAKFLAEQALEIRLWLGDAYKSLEILKQLEMIALKTKDKNSQKEYQEQIKALTKTIRSAVTH